MNGLFKDTLAELFDKKAVYLFFVISGLSMLATIYSGSAEITINGSTQGMGVDEFGFDIGKTFLIGMKALMTFFVFLAVMLSAGILPTMFIKGRADYFLAKPISRTSLLLKKFLSIWLIYGLLISTCGMACYLTGALVHSVFSNSIFLVIGYVFVQLFIWLSFSFFIGILTGKTVTTIMSLFLLWGAQLSLSYLYEYQVLVSFGYEAAGKLFDYLYFILPKMSDFSALIEDVINQSASINSYVLHSSIGFSICIIFITIALFKRKNY